jgi:phosphoglucosamine mutase
VFAHLTGRPGRSGRTRIVIGKDTRLSGYMLENALAAGVMSLGADVLLIGPLPTPGVAYITRSLRADAGIVLSASHNPYEDNGIKFFRHDGYKLDDEIEQRIEHLVFSGEIEAIRPTAGKVGRATRIDDALGRYIEFAKSSFPRGMVLENMRIAVDAANGAAYKSTPCILRELGAEVIVAHNTPNGRNINRDCGSMHPDQIQRLVRETGAHVGISHDGDADRVQLCDERGELVDGDEIMAIAALDFIQRGRLAQNTLVATIMSNFGLDETLQKNEGKVLRTKVGDRYVIEAMMKNDLNVGGEQSGHMIFRDYSTTGDGIVSALQILRIMVDTGKPLSELKRCLVKYPQAQRNVKVREKKPIEQLPDVQRLVTEAERELSGAGRVLLRYSGTEPKIRLLIEGRDSEKINARADTIAAVIREAIGAAG